MTRFVPALVLILAGVAAASASPPRPVGATQAPAEVRVAPAAITVTAGGIVNIDFTVERIDPQPGLGGYELRFSFDPAVVRLGTLADSGFVTNQRNIVTCAGQEIDNGAGRGALTCTLAQSLGAAGVSTAGPVPLAHATFTAVAPGVSAIDLQGTVLLEPGSTPLPVALAGGSITVAGPSPTPSAAAGGASPTAPPATATATATPTPAAPTSTPAPVATASPVTPAATVVKEPGAIEHGGSDSKAEIPAALGIVAVLLVVAGGDLFLWRRSRS